MSDFLITCKVLPIDMALQPKNFRMTYFLSRYPAVSHTFFLKEILGLRQMGFEIDVASVNHPIGLNPTCRHWKRGRLIKPII